MINLDGRRQFLTNAGAGVAMLALPASARTQLYPTKRIRMVVPYSAGGSSDFVGRLMAQKMGEGLGQQLIVDNRPGPGAVIGTGFVALLRLACQMRERGQQNSILSLLCDAGKRYLPTYFDAEWVAHNFDACGSARHTIEVLLAQGTQPTTRTI